MKPPASLSLDLDNQWSYLKIHGDPGWERYPSYLDLVVPRALALLRAFDARITVFIVGADAARAENVESIAEIARAGHEIGNHSYHHEPWVARAEAPLVYDELSRAHDAIVGATGIEPRGFRGPGFATSTTLFDVLARLGYRYDASRLPTFIGPLARWYYFRGAALSREERALRGELFGSWRDGLHRNRAHDVATRFGPLVEVPVTTMPGARVPIHFSYLHYLERLSPRAAERYFVTALALCRITRTQPSLLLHPLDFLGGDDVPSLRFFPGMDRSGAEKLAATERFVRILAERFAITTVAEHACA
ncbi:MAG: polysaccharide deacetylase family protein [bacterium]|nr:polysaccharide deacetylase family protein [bacterium]